MENFFEENFNMRYFEMNKHGEASPVTILTLLEETAAEHCDSIGYSLYELKKQKIGWLLISGVMDMTRYPKYKENITIKTWLSKYSLIKGYRENYIFDENKNLIGRARGLWVFFDIEKRKPTPIFDEIKTKWGFYPEISVDANLELIDQPDDGYLNKEFEIYSSDIDSYNHVNNIRYFQFLMDSLPREIVDQYHLKVINGKFLNEAKFGEKINVYRNDNLGDSTFLHTMKCGANEKIFAKAHTQWTKALRSA